MKKKNKTAEEAQVNPELKGLDIRVNEFGEIISNISPDRLNDFLDRNVIDKKLEEKKRKEAAMKKNIKKTKKTREK